MLATYDAEIASAVGAAKTEKLVAKCAWLTQRDRLIEALEVVQTLQQLPEAHQNAALEMTVQKLLGAIKAPLGDHLAAQQHYHQAIRLQDSLQLPDAGYEAQLGLARLFIKQSQPSEALSILEALLPDSNSMTGKALQECYFYLSNAHFNLQQVEQANRFRARSLALADTTNPQSLNLQGRALVAQAQLQFMSGAHEAAIQSCKQAMAIGQQTQSLELLARCYSGLGTIYGATGKHDLQEETFLELLAAAEQSGNAEMLHIAHNNLSSCYFSLGRFEESVYRLVDANKYFVERINEENQAAMTRAAMEFSFEAERKAKAQEIQTAKLELAAETAQNRLLIGGLLAAVALILVSVLAYRRTSRARKETALKNALLNQSLREKDLLMKEIHHRVKNNLQLLSSLLDMQSGSIDDESVRSVFAEGKNRVEAMSLIHQKLYRTDDVAHIDFVEYLHDMKGYFADACADRKLATPAFHIHCPNLKLDVDTAIPLALMVNELMTNSVKYAFVDNPQPEIGVHISAQPEPGSYALRYWDNGPGLPTDFDWKKNNTMGIRLVRVLAQQLLGNINYAFEEGQCTFAITFKDQFGRHQTD